MDLLKYLGSQTQLSSIDCMAGLPEHSYLLNGREEIAEDGSPKKKQCCKCITFTCLIAALNHAFRDNDLKNWPDRKKRLETILTNTHLNENEIQKYVFIDQDIPYTRNLVFSDQENYTLILMCWNPKKESKIHDHPCDGCFVKTLRGGVKESRYHMEEETGENGDVRKFMVFDFDYTTSAGEVNYMDDNLGYHKIGCATEELAITLHLYTPPFQSCKVSSL